MNLFKGIAGVVVIALGFGVGCSKAVDAGKQNDSSANNHEVMADTFEAEVLKVKGLVMVDFWAPWCRPCLMIAPILDELAKEYDGKFQLKKVNVDKNAELSQQYKVKGIPYLVLFKDGKMVDSKVGAADKATCKAWIDQHL